MTRTEHLLVIAAEECAEIMQRCSKALRFGMDEIQPGQSSSNAERIVEEYADLVAVLMMLRRECGTMKGVSDEQLEAKRQKVEKFLGYSLSLGTLALGKEGRDAEVRKRPRRAVCKCGHTRVEHEIHPDEHCYRCSCNQFKRLRHS